MSLPKIRSGWWEVERGGVACVRLCGLNYVLLDKVCAAMGMTEKELCAKITSSAPLADSEAPPAKSGHEIRGGAAQGFGGSLQS